MRPVRLTSAILLSLALAATAACSAQTSTPEEAARQLVQNLLDEDVEGFCDLVAAGGELPDEETKKECVDGLGKEMIGLEADQRKEMENFLEEGAEKVEEDGDRATVTLTEEDVLGFVKVDEAWYWDPLAE